MEVKILKCDRCKKEVDVLVDINLVNTNVEIKKDESIDDAHSLASSMFGLGGTTKYPRIESELCYGGWDTKRIC